jgi:hypothetical protein
MEDLMRKLVFRILLSLGLAAAVFGQGNNPRITIDENCNGVILFAGPGVPMPCVKLADPGPGGLASAVTYNLLGPPSLVAGDLLLLEPGGGGLISDLIRFNPAGTGNPNYPASIVFYSDTIDGADSLADTGFPNALYTNTMTVVEVGPEGNNGFVYTPTDGQPGFVAGFSTTYNILSDSPVPEPATISLVLVAGGLLFAGRRWLQARTN